MPARQFFTVYRAAQKKESQKIGFFLWELCLIGVCGNPMADGAWVEGLRQEYRKRWDPDAAKPKMLDNEVAGAILQRLFGGSA